jgi:hypothetical protein
VNIGREAPTKSQIGGATPKNKNMWREEHRHEDRGISPKEDTLLH